MSGSPKGECNTSFFNKVLLKLYTPPATSSHSGLPPPPPVLVQGEEEYEIDYLVDIWKSQGGVQYLVHWKGYPIEEWTWEPKSALPTQVVSDFHKAHPEASI